MDICLSLLFFPRPRRLHKRSDHFDPFTHFTPFTFVFLVRPFACSVQYSTTFRTSLRAAALHAHSCPLMFIPFCSVHSSRSLELNILLTSPPHSRPYGHLRSSWLRFARQLRHAIQSLTRFARSFLPLCLSERLNLHSSPCELLGFENFYRIF